MILLRRRARGRRRLVLPLAALLLAAAASACGRPMLGVGRVVPGVQPDSVALELLLIGDAGLPAPRGEPVLSALQQTIAWDPERTFVVYLGDNVYPRGLTDSTSMAEREEGERILDRQIDALRESGVRGLFVPGNHDWDAGAPDGWRAIVRQDRYIDRRGEGRVQMLPDGGCPGPVILDFGEVLRLIAIDTQWWLHGDPKPQGPSSYCPTKNEQQVVDSLRVALATAGTKRTVVVAHHPLVSGGEHGGYFDWPTYLFPFHPWVRLGGLFARQDVTGREYRNMASAMERAFITNRPLVYAAGHEHNLQVLRRDPARYLVVSGAGFYGHTTPTRAITGTRFVQEASGFVRVTFLRDGRVRLGVIVADASGNGREVYSTFIEEERFPVAPVPDAAPDSVRGETGTPRTPPPAGTPSVPPPPPPPPGGTTPARPEGTHD